MYIKRENKEAALEDATQCVKNKPDWAKVTICFRRWFNCDSTEVLISHLESASAPMSAF